MKVKVIHLLLLLLIQLYAGKTCFAQNNCPPPNIGFEDGSFVGWECDIGQANGLTGIGNPLVTFPVYGRQTLISKSFIVKNDFYGGFPTLCPNGSNYSIKLGNEQAGAQAEQVSYVFSIDSLQNNYSLFFNYAVVLENPGHSPSQQPRFTARIYNITDKTYVDCASFEFVAGPDLPGFKISKKSPTVYYKDWATANINLQGYAGKTIRLEFTTNDCTLGGHFGYAYLDVNQNCSLPITGNSYCTGQKSITLTGPSGFDTYQWYDTANRQVGSDQVLRISPPPENNTVYNLVLTPLAGLGCVAKLQTVVNKINAGFNFVVKDTIYGCPNSTVDLTDKNVTAGSSGDFQLAYSSDSDGTKFLYHPDAIDSSGVYYIKGVNAQGCSNILPVVVIFQNDILIKIAAPLTVVYPSKANLSKSFLHSPGIIYSYFKDKAATINIDPQVDSSGTYYIKATSALGCSNVAAINVTVLPPPSASIKSSNTFTPNGDGINDYFFLTIDGYEHLKALTIYSRNGQKVFETKNILDKWDGTFAGQPLNTGAYYWVYEGINDYTGKQTRHAGFITLIR